jgi:drug/metabolite transporter (DMT)-like permease
VTDKVIHSRGAAPSRPLADWLLLGALTLLWAAAYAFTRIAVGKDTAEGLPAAWVLPGRLAIGATFLWCVLLVSGKRLPPFSDRRSWAFMAGMGLVGSVVPFFLITTAQEHVDSSLAALYAAAAPVFFAVMAHVLLPAERLSRQAAFGIAMGFAGVAVLFGPDALSAIGGTDISAQLLLLLATAAYASSTMIARLAPQLDPIVFATGYATIAAITALPLTLTVTPEAVTAGWPNWLAVLGLGLGSSGLAQLLYMTLIQRAGGTFSSLAGYTIPIVSAALGWVLFRETQDWNAVLAFVLILGGVWIARNSGQGRGAQR